MSDNILDVYRELHRKFEATSDHDVEDVLIDQMDSLWYQMTQDERDQARKIGNNNE